jgi:Protein of unknown function (DUF1499)
VKTITLDMEPEETFKAAREAVTQLRWKILEEVHPGGPRQPEGHIEALARSTALGIPRLVNIRIRPGEGETRLDVRVVTRYLPSDFGAGAALIGKFGDIIEEKDDSE